MKRQPVLVGVTGGIGSGKSTVCAMLAELGCELFEADRIARELQLKDPGVIEGIRNLFGDDIYFLDGSGNLQIDRKRIAEVVFSDRSKLEALAVLIHPKVFDAFSNTVDRCAREGVKILVKEAAILFESGRDGDLDRIIVVAANRETRLQRAMAKGMGCREDILKRMQAQWPQERLIERADYVIFNDGSLEELRAQTEEVFRKISSFAESACNS
jgi:dephospho-CoA kinase